MSLRYDILFQFSKFAKLQKKLLNTVHTLTNNVIKEKKIDFEEKLAKGQQQKEEEQNNKPTDTSSTNISDDANYTKLHYVRDDLDDIDENDVGEKKRLAFLELLLEMKKNGGQMTDEEIWEEVNTIMFEV